MPLQIQAPREARSGRVNVTVPGELWEKLVLYCELLGIPTKRAGYVLVEAFARFLERDRDFLAAWERRGSAMGANTRVAADAHGHESAEAEKPRRSVGPYDANTTPERA